MFIGHFALGFAAKKAVPEAPLPVLLAAPELLDLIWPILLLTGVETVRIAPGNTAFTPLEFVSYPWSHSLLMAAVWGALFGGTLWLLTRKAAVAALIFGLVVSHWVLDWVTHRPDMPLSPWGTMKLGLGLWNSPAATLLVEGVMFAAGVALYASSYRPKGVSRYAFWALVLFLVASYLGAAFGPPPPDVPTLAYGGLALWLLPLWAWWIERYRLSTSAS